MMIFDIFSIFDAKFVCYCAVPRCDIVSRSTVFATQCVSRILEVCHGIFRTEVTWLVCNGREKIYAVLHWR